LNCVVGPEKTSHEIKLCGWPRKNTSRD